MLGRSERTNFAQQGGLAAQASGEDWVEPALRRCWRTPATPRSKTTNGCSSGALRSHCQGRRGHGAARSRFSRSTCALEEALRKSSKATVDVVRSTRMASRSPTVRNPRSAKKQKLLEETVEHLVVMASARCRQVESPWDPAHQQCIARRAGMAGRQYLGHTTPARSARRSDRPRAPPAGVG